MEPSAALDEARPRTPKGGAVREEKRAGKGGARCMEGRAPGGRHGTDFKARTAALLDGVLYRSSSFASRGTVRK